MSMKVRCLLCQGQAKDTILGANDAGIIARNFQEEMMNIGQLMSKHMDTVHNQTLVNEIRAIPMYNGFNVMKYFHEEVVADKQPMKTILAGQEVETTSEFNSQKEFMRTQLSEQIMQCAPELEEDDELEEDGDEPNFDEEEEDDEEDDTTEDEECSVCECNPCQCDEDEDEDLDEDED